MQINKVNSFNKEYLSFLLTRREAKLKEIEQLKNDVERYDFDLNGLAELCAEGLPVFPCLKLQGYAYGLSIIDKYEEGEIDLNDIVTKGYPEAWIEGLDKALSSRGN